MKHIQNEKCNEYKERPKKILQENKVLEIKSKKIKTRM